jgi:hypothetical protein
LLPAADLSLSMELGRKQLSGSRKVWQRARSSEFKL